MTIRQFNLLNEPLDALKEDYPPIDIIMSGLSGATVPMCCMAESMGFKNGFNTDHMSLKKQICTNHPVTFIDNPFMKYDHEKHFSMLKKFKPKYGTARDYFTEIQCKEKHIQFYSLETIKEWVEELRPYVENIIVIPKSKELIKHVVEIKNVVVGYSIAGAFSHSKQLLPKDFAEYDCKIHLLGGDPMKQVRYYNKLKDHVISCDTAVVGMMSNKAIMWHVPDITANSMQLPYLYGNYRFRNGAERRNILYSINLGTTSLIWRKYAWCGR